ncbi:hypothetical protein GCM10010236_35650 [Streptomyces eurythermus]|nr:hypothetical protein GCM10010236_35650 [Streptomyces eurythermus]
MNDRMADAISRFLPGEPGGRSGSPEGGAGAGSSPVRSIAAPLSVVRWQSRWAVRVETGVSGPGPAEAEA